MAYLYCSVHITLIVAHCAVSMMIFEPVSMDDVFTAVRLLLDKQSDTMPTGVLKNCVDLLALFLSTLFCRSLAHDVVPRQFKVAYVTPLLKNADLDLADVGSYQPISNLSILSKVLELQVARWLVGYLNDADLMSVLQSALRTVRTIPQRQHSQSHGRPSQDNRQR